MRLEQNILSEMIHNDEFCRKVLPFLKGDYFSDRIERIVYEEIFDFIEKYNKLPSKEILSIETSNRTDLSETDLKAALGTISSFKEQDTNLDWLLDSTEKFCQRRAIHLAIRQSILIMDGQDKKHTQDAIPNLLQNALAVTFDNSVGHDYIEDAEARYDFYHKVEEKIPFSVKLFNTITKGGISKKTLNVIVAGVNVGKSLILCDIAASTLMQGKNVVYITLEMAEERISERIDANLFNLSLDEVMLLEKPTYFSRIDRIKNKTQGKLIVKQFPTGAAHTGHFRAFLQELKIKKGIIPDLLIVDYLTICASSRLRMAANINQTIYIQSIAEELRGLAIELNIPILSAAQLSAEGYTSSDPGMENTAGSKVGLPATCDLLLAVIENDELIKLNQYMCKQLKNRYADKTKNGKFVVGVDKSKFKIYDVEQCAQTDTSSDDSEDDNYSLEITQLRNRTAEGWDFGND